jgi:MFS family permease
VGPIAGGFLSAAAGWRWIFWLLALTAGVTSIIALVFMRESYAPVILERKTKKLRKQTGNERLRSKLDIGLDPKELFKLSIVRPSKLMLLSPICFLMSMYIAFVVRARMVPSEEKLC